MQFSIFPFYSNGGRNGGSRTEGRGNWSRVIMAVWMVLLLSVLMARSSNAIADASKIPGGGSGDDSSSSNVAELSPTITTAPSITTALDSSTGVLRLRTTCESGQQPKSTSKFGRVFCSQSSRLLPPLLSYLISASSILLISCITLILQSNLISELP